MAALVYALISPPVPSRTPPKYLVTTHRQFPHSFPANHIPLFNNVQKANATYNKLINFAMVSPALQRRKSIWYGILEKESSNLIINMYSGKK